MPEDPGQAAGSERFLIFFIGGRALALAAGRVREVVRVPRLQRVPHAPAALVGLANIRGAVVPVIDLARDSSARPGGEGARILIIEAGSVVGLLVERVASLSSGTDATVPAEEGGAGFSDGLIRLEGGLRAHVVALDRLLAEIFPGSASRASRAGERHEPVEEHAAARADDRLELVSFEISGQLYALPLEALAEIVALPPTLSAVPRTGAHILGMVPYRGGLLPVVSTAALLGLPATARSSGARVVVARIGRALAGLVVDAVQEILRVEEQAVDQVPALLRTEGAEIQAICRLDGGRRLVSVLSTEGLFDEAAMDRMAHEQAGADATARSAAPGSEGGDRFVLFRVAGDLFGLPVAAVAEVVRPPETLTRIPKAPAFLEGVMNLRGAALPVIDQRRRFDLPPAPADAPRRIIVLSLDGSRVGLIVDEVTEVRLIPDAAIMPAPAVAEDQARIVPRVAAREDGEGLLLLMDPKGLLDTTERRLLASLGRDRKTLPAA